MIAGFLFTACATVDLNGLNPDNYENLDGGPSSNEPNPFALTNCEDVDSTYSTSVQPAFNATCSDSSCHVNYSGAGASSKLDLDPNIDETASSMITAIRNSSVINNFNFFQSTIITAPLSKDQDGTDHVGGVIFNSKTDSNFEKIYCWVEGGLKYDLDNDHNFGEEIIGIFASCQGAGCHSNVSGRLNLRNNLTPRQLYANIISSSGNGPFVISNNPGNSLLYQNPQGNNGHDNINLPAAQLTSLLAWINAGIPAD